MIPAFVIAVLSLWGGVSAVDQWRYAAGAGQIAATITQGAYGVLGLAVGLVALWRPRARVPVIWSWALALIATGTLAPVVWGEASWLAGAAGGLATAIFAGLLVWWLIAATAPSLWHEGPRHELLARLSRLAPETRPRWGLMNACQMITHVNDQFRMALGDLPTVPKRMAMRYPPLNALVAYVLPWPKGSPTAPELLARINQSSWAVEVATFATLLNRFAALPPGTLWPVHPAFGRLSRRGWAKLGYRHTDHHFRQFGV